jgi:predicted ATP-dependent endonuclease of OLD family
MVAYKTMLCRSWFGQFIPIVRYPGLDEISMQIRQELNSARSIIAETDQKNISNVFIKVLETILSNNKEIILDDTSELIKEFKIQLDDIQSNEHSYDIYQQLNTLLNNDNLILRDSNSEILIKGILKIYNIALLERKKIKEKAYTIIENFTKSLNENFLENKSIEYNPLMTQPGSGVYIRLYDEKKSKTNFSILSSGERHILSLIFCATHMSNLDGILIIDEPELSLHVDWQRIILTEIIKQTGDRQIIVCTHSPEIAADHDDCFISIISEENIDDMILANDDFELMDLTPSLFNAIESEDLQNE